MPEATIIIRDVIAEDQDAFLRVLVDAYAQYAEVLPPPRWEQYKQSLEASFHEGAPVARIAAFADGELVGSLQLFASSIEAYGNPELDIRNPIIRYLAVSPKTRGLGIATLLIREAIRRSQSLGADRINLHTSDMMASAVRLYERLGFERAYETDVYNGETLVKGFRLTLNETALAAINSAR
ncbi:GNAT superfamily N-acetyltransferase [Paenibacillus phyllosphaerae]|uniref:GNAT superfamily N-acetyltransferase n=1 Tax=Paenibacillus phyllosphaerae TaxID=274593 RepID=A0A7W5B2K8_9BACL|nr:GNAT family N-acetyltransferase [Paenibacillus phyllosphaerae]MBB3112476.1 GNAT superfamily N-acetyltransferase [Paenibacillus phyllosphaerae]